MPSMRQQYPFDLIESKWQGRWEQEQTFRAWNPGEDVPADHPFAQRHDGKLPPKYYILDMFPYPSGAGLHVGHPEGYTATDILARYKRAKGFNVLHPMGWDSFGLPAEQYAVKTGQHPRITTEENIANFTRQIKSLGFSYDWSRELATTDPDYFKWTQWIFLQLYNSYFDPEWNKATPIRFLEDALSDEPAFREEWKDNPFLDGTHRAWTKFSAEDKTAFGRRGFIDRKRLAYVSEAPVNWCPELGTVLANEEVIDGKSEVGGFPVIRKPMRQWMLRITAYAEKLLADLDIIEWSDSLKEMQRNWIGRSEGAELDFQIDGADEKIRVFTTRPDTLFGATYMVLSPEHKLVAEITTPEQKKAVEEYQAFAATKSDLERTELAKEKTGVFTGAHAINPVNGEKIPIWIADYVLATYGTGAIMAVPAHDERDFEFARRFKLSIKAVVQPPLEWFSDKVYEKEPGYPPLSSDNQKQALESAQSIYARDPGMIPVAFCGEGVAINSPLFDNLQTTEAKKKITAWLEEKDLGKKTINFKLRDWLFSRQRYWGEPFPIVWKKDEAGNLHHEALPESELPILPPSLEDYKPTSDGQPPLARATDWLNLPDGSIRETNTMPQWAGSCWYYLRYTSAKNADRFVDKEAENYWMESGGETPGVDLYVGGTEHAVLHLLYARFWHKVLFDLGHVSTPEPFFKLVNQGIILGEDNQKMSKSRGNVVNPDDILGEYGADAFRLYEMFMGPLQDSKPWNTKGVEGVYRFLGRVWRLFIDEASFDDFEQNRSAGSDDATELLGRLKLHSSVQDSEPTKEHLKALHACIKKVTDDLDGIRLNTAISAMMVFVNSATSWEVRPRSVLQTFLQLLQPFAPHIAEELHAMLHQGKADAPSLSYMEWPKHDEQHLVEDTIEMPVQVNGKIRDKLQVPVGMAKDEIEKMALAAEKVIPFIEGKQIKKMIVVPNKLVNIVAV